VKRPAIIQFVLEGWYQAILWYPIKNHKLILWYGLSLIHLGAYFIWGRIFLFGRNQKTNFKIII